MDRGKTRQIRKFKRKTPLIVPSFSSRGFRLSEVFAETSSNIAECYLVSAYDLVYKQIPVDAAYGAPLVFLDSGGYESAVDPELAEPYTDWREGQPWNASMYDSLLSELQPLTDILATTYDNYGSLMDQFAAALQFKDNWPSFAVNLLVKPASRGSIIDVEDIESSLHLLPAVDVMGFTEKELGLSLEERARNMHRIRRALDDAGIDLPVHIFGCLDPIGVISLHRCGADIFDGLTWLRMAWHEGILEYHRTAWAAKGRWRLPDGAALLQQHRHNLHELQALQLHLSQLETTEWGKWERYRTLSDEIVSHAIGGC